MVVIAIIAILAAMLLPALSSARESARNSNCVGKLKTIGLGVQMYSGVNKDWVAVSNVATDYSATSKVPLLDNTLCNNGTESTVAPSSALDKLLVGGYMGMKLKKITEDAKEKIYKCPSDSETWVAGTATTASYFNAVSAKQIATPTKASPRKRAIIGRDNPGCATWMDTHVGLAGIAGETKLDDFSNHPSKVNIGYLGGHVGSQTIKSGSTSTDKWGFVDQITYTN